MYPPNFMFLATGRAGERRRGYLLDVEPDVRIKGPRSKGVRRIICKFDLRERLAQRKLKSVLDGIRERPLAYQAAELDGDAGVKAFVASILREIENASDHDTN